MKKHHKRIMKHLGCWEKYKVNAAQYIPLVEGVITKIETGTEIEIEAEISNDYKTLSKAFDWCKTNEGYDYWELVDITISVFDGILKQVKRVDKDAARWMKKDLFKCDCRLNLTGAESIEDLFTWSATPQGAEYWAKISIAIIDEENHNYSDFIIF